MQLFYGVPEDIENWMSLVTQVRWNFPGLETQEKLNEHRATVLKFMGKRQAICIKDENEIAGVMLFSRGHNMICCLAVSPEYRRRGVASILMDEALTNLDRTKEISVSTFRADDEKEPPQEHCMKNMVLLQTSLLKNLITQIRNMSCILQDQNEKNDSSLSILRFVKSAVFSRIVNLQFICMDRLY